MWHVSMQTRSLYFVTVSSKWTSCPKRLPTSKDAKKKKKRFKYPAKIKSSVSNIRELELNKN